MARDAASHRLYDEPTLQRDSDNAQTHTNTVSSVESRAKTAIVYMNAGLQQ